MDLVQRHRYRLHYGHILLAPKRLDESREDDRCAFDQSCGLLLGEAGLIKVLSIYYIQRQAARLSKDWQSLIAAAVLVGCIFTVARLNIQQLRGRISPSTWSTPRTSRQVHASGGTKWVGSDSADSFDSLSGPPSESTLLERRGHRESPLTHNSDNRVLVDVSSHMFKAKLCWTESVLRVQRVRPSRSIRAVLETLTVRRRMDVTFNFMQVLGLGEAHCCYLQSCTLVMERGNSGKTSSSKTQLMSGSPIQRHPLSGVSKRRVQKCSTRSSEEQSPKPRPPLGLRAIENDRRYGCPFSKHRPERYESVYGRACTSPPGLDARRIIEHLRRVHSCLTETKCRFCQQDWMSSSDREPRLSELHSHLNECSASPAMARGLPEYMNSDQEASIKTFELDVRNQSPDSLWVFLYMRLFPGASIPSPSYDYYLPRHQMAFAASQRTIPGSNSPFGDFDVARDRQTIDQDVNRPSGFDLPGSGTSVEDGMDSINIFDLFGVGEQVADIFPVLKFEERSGVNSSDVLRPTPRRILPACSQRTSAVYMQDFGNDEVAPAARSEDATLSTAVSDDALVSADVEMPWLIEDALTQEIACVRDDVYSMEAFSQPDICDALGTSQGIDDFQVWLTDPTGVFPEWQILNDTTNLASSGFWDSPTKSRDTMIQGRATSPEPDS